MRVKDPAAAAMGPKGGKARAESMSAEQRAAVARKGCGQEVGPGLTHVDFCSLLVGRENRHEASDEHH